MTIKPITFETYNALLAEVEAGNITMREATALAEKSPATDPRGGGMGQLGIEELFKAVMREIKEMTQEALGYEQICEPVQAVRRLAQDFAATKARLASARATIHRLEAAELAALAALDEVTAQLAEANREREYERSMKEQNAAQADRLVETVESLSAQLAELRQTLDADESSGEKAEK